MKQNVDSISTIEGDLEKITYFNERTHYTIARLKTASAVRPITIIGFLSGIQPGETLKVKGFWETHPKFGEQFRVKTCEIKLPSSIQGIRKYLQSGVIKGIGSQLANRMVNHFGDHTLDIIENYPQRLLEIEGIGKNKAFLITEAWKKHHVLRGLLLFLQDMGIKPAYGAKIFHIYGPHSLEVLQKTPYQLAEDIPGIGFQLADTIAKKLGIKSDDPVRIAACILNTLELYANEGHTFALKNHLMVRCEHLYKIPQPVIDQIIQNLSDSGELIVDKISFDPDESREYSFFESTTECINNKMNATVIYQKSLYKAETGIASRIMALLSVPFTPEKVDLDFFHPQIARELTLEPSLEQQDILRDVFFQKAAVISGGPGTGKTTLIHSLAYIFKVFNKRVILGAPTGRAARKLEEATGQKAFTIHRLLGFTYSATKSDHYNFERNQDNPLEADVVVIDEASMIDTLLMYHLINAIPLTTRLIFVGDVFQLPSVGPGNILSDLIHSGIIKVYYLNSIFRQAKSSTIITNAHKIRSGELFELISLEKPSDYSDFYFLEENNPKKVAEKIVELCSTTIPSMFSLEPFSEIQVISPMHKGDAGIINLNALLQKTLNPSQTQMEVIGNTFKLGDKVMHLKNNYQKEVFNGDIGIICSMDTCGDISVGTSGKKLKVNYDGRIVEYEHGETDELALAYAISVHKSQGSEYPAVILPMTTQHYMLLQRNLLYTAITRGIKLVFMVGSRKALDIAISNDKPCKRLSGLLFHLKRIIKQ